MNMFPGMGKMNPRQMQAMLKQFGIKSEEVKAKRVVFELENGKVVIENPQVTAMDVQGQKTYTVMGEAREEKGVLEVPEEDIQMVMDQTGASKEDALNALKECNGDIAEAIARLKKE